ncbi:hypothetical protein ccbrp13_08410 [Ktedonobacteria bacterium brp13]|nr:hypothetical protein ccbrp13_08410 [Ktedonobacteria bacterium brp13]
MLNTGNPRGEETQPPTYLHGEALARDPWAERYGPWLILAFAIIFSLFLLFMQLIGQTPGKSFSLKGTSDIFQFAGEALGFLFCVRIALRLRKVSNQLRRQMLGNQTERRAAGDLADLHNEALVARRAFLAWSSLSIAIALYACGQAIWTSYDIRMSSADVPFPGLYDIGFVASYPFFLIGTLLLTRRNKASVGRVRLLLDSLAVIGTSLTLSWFFLLSPIIAGLTQQPSTGAAVLSIYFPTGDLFLVAIGAFLMFSPLASRAQQPVFMLLCMGLFFLAVTDSLLAYYSLSNSFNTGTLQDVLWPLSMALVGLAAIEYPRSVAREQEQAERLKGLGLGNANHAAPTKLSQLSLTAQTIIPFILVLATCALLLTNIAPRGGATLVEADLVALALVLIVIARQALTLLENNRLTMQMRGELVISRRELQVTRREANEATRSAQDKQVMEEGITTLREVHARVARGDIRARAQAISGPLLPIAISLNLMLDRISALAQRGEKYDQLANECRTLQEGVERLGQGSAPWSEDQTMPRGATELRSVYLGLAHVYRMQESQKRRIAASMESMSKLTRRISEALSEIKRSHIFTKEENAGFERMVLDRVVREVDLLEQQQSNAISLLVHNREHVSQPPVIESQHALSSQHSLISSQHSLNSNEHHIDSSQYRNAGYTPQPANVPVYHNGNSTLENPFEQRAYQIQRLKQIPLDK